MPTQILHFSKTDVPAGINYGILELLKQNFLWFSTADFRRKKKTNSNIQHHINKTKNTNSIFHSVIQFQKWICGKHFITIFKLIKIKT
jgi:hypothetical protein